MFWPRLTWKVGGEQARIFLSYLFNISCHFFFVLTYMGWVVSGDALWYVGWSLWTVSTAVRGCRGSSRGLREFYHVAGGSWFCSSSSFVAFFGVCKVFEVLLDCLEGINDCLGIVQKLWRGQRDHWSLLGQRYRRTLLGFYQQTDNFDSFYR